MNPSSAPNNPEPLPGGAFRLRGQRRNPRRVRTVIFWALGLYAAAQCLMTFIMTSWDPTGMFEGRDKCARLTALMAEEPGRPLLVMMGSSRTDFGFRADRLNGMPCPGARPFLAYNFGVSGLGPLREGLCLKEMLDAGIRPRLLLVEFFPPLFNKGRPHIFSEEGWNLGLWLTARQLHRLQPFCARPDLMLRTWLRCHVSPFCCFRNYLQAFLTMQLSPEMIQGGDQTFDHLGSRLHKQMAPEIQAIAGTETFRMYYYSLSHFQMGIQQKRALRDLLLCCRREKIPVILVRMPESEIFRSWYPKKAQAALNKLLDQCHKTYGVEVIDANTWVPDWGFSDGHHLACIGAEIFTAKLGKALRRILSRGDTELARLVPTRHRAH